MSDGVDKRIMLFVTTNLPNEEGGVDNEAEDNYQEEDNPKDKKCNFSPIEEDPAHVKGDGKGHQASAKSNKKCYRFAASTSNTHAGILKQ